jgi:hypothetical protein
VLAACESAVAEFEARMLRGFNRAERTRFLAMIKSAVRNLGGGFHGAAQRPTGDESSPPPRARRAPSRRAA